jgi:hypothetical protein
MTAGPNTVQVNSFHFVSVLAGTPDDQASLSGDQTNRNTFTDSFLMMTAQMVSSAWHEYIFGFAVVDGIAGTNDDNAILIGSVTMTNTFDGFGTDPSMYTTGNGPSLGVSATNFRNVTAYAGNTLADSAVLIGSIGETNVYRGNADVPDGSLSNADYTIRAMGFGSIQFNAATNQDTMYLHGNDPTRYKNGLEDATVDGDSSFFTASDFSTKVNFD